MSSLAEIVGVTPESSGGIDTRDAQGGRIPNGFFGAGSSREQGNDIGFNHLVRSFYYVTER